MFSQLQFKAAREIANTFRLEKTKTLPVFQASSILVVGPLPVLMEETQGWL